jgi:multidrug efflux pump subunit AcrB
MVAYVTMPQGTPVEVTTKAVEQLARAADEVESDFDSNAFRHVFASVGQQPYRLKQATGPSAFESGLATGGHLGEVQLEVAHEDLRSHSVGDLLRLWRERTGQIPGAEELSFNASLLSAGAPLAIQLQGSSLTELRSAARELKERVASYPGVIDLSDSFRGGKQELELTLLPSAQALGLTLQDLASQVRQAFYGLEVQRFQRGRDDVRVMVRYPAAQRRSLGDLQSMMIRTTDGAAVPFTAVASASVTEGYATIKRADRRRIVTVSADIDDSVANANEIVADLKRIHLPELGREYPGVFFSFEGEQREQGDFLASLGRGWAMALIAIYALLAVPLRSYVQPFIIMAAIPFGLVGAVWGHILMGHDFSMFSLIGIVALSGIVVNDSLVLVDWINRMRQRGASLSSAIREAGAARFRAIMLTSLTTFAGLSPLLFEKSVQAQMLIPMAISLAFGVIFATVITLFLVPSGYLIVEDGRELIRRLTSAKHPGTVASATPTG